MYEFFQPFGTFSKFQERVEIKMKHLFPSSLRNIDDVSHVARAFKQFFIFY